MWGALWAIAKWIIKVAVVVMKWAVAHPVVAILVGGIAQAAGLWLRNQPWEGADLLGSLIFAYGGIALGFGVGVLAGKWLSTATWAERGAAAVGAALSWGWLEGWFAFPGFGFVR